MNVIRLAIIPFKICFNLNSTGTSVVIVNATISNFITTKVALAMLLRSLSQSATILYYHYLVM